MAFQKGISISVFQNSGEQEFASNWTEHVRKKCKQSPIPGSKDVIGVACDFWNRCGEFLHLSVQRLHACHICGSLRGSRPSQAFSNGVSRGGRPQQLYTYLKFCVPSCRYEADIALAVELGITSFRLSIEWHRCASPQHQSAVIPKLFKHSITYMYF